MKQEILLTAMCALLVGFAHAAAAQQALPWNAPDSAPQAAPGPAIAPQYPAPVTTGTQVPVTESASPPPSPAPVAGQQVLYAVKTVNIRAGAGRQYNAIGKVPAGQGVAVVGQVPGGWYQLASGGFVSASVLSPTPVVVVHHPHPHPLVVPPPSQAYFPVGACEPYNRVVNIGGQPNQINGTACKQPDGTWRISNYGVPTPASGVVVQPAPIVGPPPVVYAAPPSCTVRPRSSSSTGTIRTGAIES